MTPKELQLIKDFVNTPDHLQNLESDKAFLTADQYVFLMENTWTSMRPLELADMQTQAKAMQEATS